MTRISPASSVQICVHPRLNSRCDSRRSSPAKLERRPSCQLVHWQALMNTPSRKNPKLERSRRPPRAFWSLAPGNWQRARFGARRASCASAPEKPPLIVLKRSLIVLIVLAQTRNCGLAMRRKELGVNSLGGQAGARAADSKTRQLRNSRHTAGDCSATAKSASGLLALRLGPAQKAKPLVGFG